MIESGRIILRPLEPNDIDFLYQWENDTALWQYSDTIAPLSRTLLEDYIATYDADIFKARQLRLMIDLKTDGEQKSKSIGTIDIFNLDVRHLRAYIGILIAAEYRCKGYAKESLAMIEHYARDVVGLRQLVAHVPVNNTSSLKLFIESGYELSGCLRQWHRFGSDFIDVNVLQHLL